MLSEAVAPLGVCADDMAFVHNMVGKTGVHSQGTLLQATGFNLPGFPGAGAWVSYGLGSLNDNLPTFVVLPDHRGFASNGPKNWDSAFLPSQHAGTIIYPGAETPIADLFPHKSGRYITPKADREGFALLEELNRKHLQQREDDSRLDSRIRSYELAAKMQLAAPEVFDLTKESKATHELYGTAATAHEGGFAKNCLLARRMLERNVRFVQIWSGQGGPSNNWDNHTNIAKELPPIARQVDRPVAALLGDLKSKGLLADTLVIFTTEFGRMPFTQGGVGRDHNGGTFVTWLAGAGIKAGATHGESDEFSYRAAKDATDGHDLSATLLHLMGIDHEKLAVRHDGIDRRLTDVHGRVIRSILV